jgi:hypothetical protein
MPNWHDWQQPAGASQLHRALVFRPGTATGADPLLSSHFFLASQSENNHNKVDFKETVHAGPEFVA